MSEEDLEKIENLIKKCDKCKLKECINCEISCADVKAIEHLIKAYKELEEKQIIKNEQIRNGQPVIVNTRLTVLDVLYLITEFIKRHEEEFRKDYADISINQIISAIDYFIDNRIPVSLVEEMVLELKNAKKTINKENWKYIYQMQINILQELLEKRK